MTDKYFIDRDKLKQEIQWVEDIIEKGGCCFICFYNDDPLVLELFELHHIGKRNNTNVTITVCPICHAKLTRKQKSWDGECNNKDSPPERKLAFHLVGRHEVLKMMAEEDKKLAEEILKGKFK